MAEVPCGSLVVTSPIPGTIISLHHVLDSTAIRSTHVLTYCQQNIQAVEHYKT